MQAAVQEPLPLPWAPPPYDDAEHTEGSTCPRGSGGFGSATDGQASSMASRGTLPSEDAQRTEGSAWRGNGGGFGSTTDGRASSTASRGAPPSSGAAALAAAAAAPVAPSLHTAYSDDAPRGGCADAGRSHPHHPYPHSRDAAHASGGRATCLASPVKGLAVALSEYEGTAPPELRGRGPECVAAYGPASMHSTECRHTSGPASTHSRPLMQWDEHERSSGPASMHSRPPTQGDEHSCGGGGPASAHSHPASHAPTYASQATSYAPQQQQGVPCLPAPTPSASEAERDVSQSSQAARGGTRQVWVGGWARCRELCVFV